MSLSHSFFSPCNRLSIGSHFPLRVLHPINLSCSWAISIPSAGSNKRKIYGFTCINGVFFPERVSLEDGTNSAHLRSLGRSEVFSRPQITRTSTRGRGCTLSALCISGLTGSQMASSAFTWSTAAVLPFYTLMVLAPKSELTKRSMESNMPFAILGLVYTYLLYHSWTPDSFKYMFASKYLLPELPGIAKMFSNELTLASAWVHLLTIDLYAARQVFRDGLENKIETRHSVSLCLLFCPIGVTIHAITKVLTRVFARKTH